MSLSSKGLQGAQGFAHSYGPQDPGPLTLLVMLWVLPGVVICLFTPYRVMQASLGSEKESPSQNSASGQGQWCLTLAPCQETSRNTSNHHLFWWVYHGVQLSCLTMGHFRHFTLYSESCSWGRTALYVSASLWFTCCPWHQMASDKTAKASSVRLTGSKLKI